ncbi:MAG: DUF5996 family protein [Steroidobacteraceae bacterium]
MSSSADDWPALPYERWRDTVATLQLWTQIVGKVRLALTPWVNHSWHVPLYVTSRGLWTSPIPAGPIVPGASSPSAASSSSRALPCGSETFEIEFDFVAHRLRLRSSSGAERALALEPQTVADFHDRLFGLLSEIGIEVRINEMPSELPSPIAFFRDRSHASYDAAAAHAFWRVLLRTDRILKLFRSGFLGKVSPVHFFWGSFDLAVTRFSGRRAPLHPAGMPGLPDAVAREAYSHEVSSAGFWPGHDAFPRAAFYSYAYPEPPGFRERPPTPGAYFGTTLGEFILPYETVRTAANPEGLLLDFLASTYAAAADAGHWDRAALECEMGAPGRVRPV